ncbi:adenylate/guanylate cyclase domain-containing protein [Cohaesibacter sp. CAU 1516]|uniref:adenylate/guanylate cyclase domain-containing protein n=1 Tax=Cohaesibacter sp. CAU 1516 TaxID=2576038 RepID=UPI001AED78FF|nr:adenylate/guanylate cyclase domain-containing protein [Cohaesibacter sp. CAU 1516]
MTLPKILRTIINMGHNRPDEHVPRRVLREIQTQEEAAEILIGWVQLLVICLFGTLYLIAPRAEGGNLGHNFVPMALVGYLLFTLAKLFLAHRQLLPNWLIILSILIDVSMLLGIIFSYHIQYLQHPSFYLKSPTFLYLFLFIALRSLRFDARYVLFTGAVAVVGWIGMLGYALFSDMDGMLITRNYVTYITSDSILIGAELDKIFVIIAVTIILTLMLLRGRSLLFTAVKEQTATQQLQRFFSDDVARSITDSDEVMQAGEGELRDAAIMLVDVRGFTRISADLAPELTIQILADYQSIVVPLIEKAGGSVDKFLGDGILATFGAVTVIENPAARALEAAESIILTMAEKSHAFTELGWPEPFRIGVAVDFGRVMVGVIGVHDRLEFTVIGDAVNRTAKLEDANKAQQSCLVTSKACFERAVEDGFTPGSRTDHRIGVPVAGLPDPIDIVVWPEPERRA